MKRHAIHFLFSTSRGLTGFAVVLAVVAALTAASPATAAVKDSISFIPESFSQLADTIGPAVVNIRTEVTASQGGPMMQHPFFNSPFGENDPFNDFFERFFNAPHGRQFKQRSLGSGFIIDAKGLIVTNNHVVEKADTITVKLKDGDEYEAEVVGNDANTDLALLRIKAKRPLPSLKLGDSDNLKVGEWVVAIGS
ncbi:MAG: trypsin-like peptidase domain-containing protein, partial [Thermodesulfobacteriota bacterium]